MNNFVHQGHIVEVTAPYDVAPGDGLLRGVLFGIATSWAMEGEPVEVSTSGVFDIVRMPTDQWDVGDRIYWNDTERRFTREPENAVLVGFALTSTAGVDRPSLRAKLIGHAT